MSGTHEPLARRRLDASFRAARVSRSRPPAALLVAMLVALPGCGSDASNPASADIAACTIARLSDGDSLHCVERDERVRLLLIDAPELAQAPWGDSAKAALEALLPEGRQVRLEYDAERRDDYGRLLAYLWLDDGRMVNEVMAAAGYVVELYYPPNDLYRDRIEAAVEAARIARRGLWATTAFDCLPVDFRAARCGSD